MNRATAQALGAKLRQASAGDPGVYQQLRARVAAGEPVAYVLGYCEFMGRRFAMDRRAYVTDPELEWLLRAVLQRGDQLAHKLNRAPRILEFGVGAGTLAITLKLERPDWSISGIDIDGDALSLARENAARHAVELELIQSDLLQAWPAECPNPDLIFGDPPWGSTEDLYDSSRNADYYNHMPRHSVYPAQSGRTGVHDALIAAVVQGNWPTELLLNYGILPTSEIERSAAPLRHAEILRASHSIHLLHGWSQRSPARGQPSG